MTVPRRLGSGIDEADDEIAKRRFRIADEFAGGRAVGGENHLLMFARTERIDGKNGRAFVAAGRIERLADDGAAANHAGMAGGRHEGAVDAGE